MELLKNIGLVALLILALDSFAFMFWVMSGQTPVDNFYAGAITANTLHFILY